MTRVADREKARQLRAEGKSYSEIKQILGVGKGTLSGWLSHMPLSPEQIRLLRDINPRRIENFRETMRKKRELRLEGSYDRAQKDIGRFSRRDLFIAGLHLYWGEGLKSQRGTVGVANTDPAIALAFIRWMKMLGIDPQQLRIKMHFYADMDIQKETKYWSSVLSIPIEQFRKPYIKNSNLSGFTYKTGYGHGTCNVLFENMLMWEYITMALKYIREQHMRP